MREKLVLKRENLGRVTAGPAVVTPSRIIRGGAFSQLRPRRIPGAVFFARPLDRRRTKGAIDAFENPSAGRRRLHRHPFPDRRGRRSGRRLGLPHQGAALWRGDGAQARSPFQPGRLGCRQAQRPVDQPLRSQARRRPDLGTPCMGPAEALEGRAEKVAPDLLTNVLSVLEGNTRHAA